MLIVEDEALVAMLLEEFLQDLGYEVEVASRLEDALDKARRIHVDAVVLDVNLAGKLSYPVAHVLRERDIPFLFATGYGSAGLPDGMADVPVLLKPFKLEQIADALQAILRD